MVSISCKREYSILASSSHSTLTCKYIISGDKFGNSLDLSFTGESPTLVHYGLDVTVEHDKVWEEEDRRVGQFCGEGCRRSLDGRKECSRKFIVEYFHYMRDDCLDLSHDQLDIFVMGQMTACVNRSNMTVNGRSKRQHSHTIFYVPWKHAHARRHLPS